MAVVDWLTSDLCVEEIKCKEFISVTTEINKSLWQMW